MENDNLIKNTIAFNTVFTKLKSEYPEIEIVPNSDNKYALICNLPFKGINVELRNGFHCEFAFNFENFKFIDYAALQIYFKNKLEFQNVDFHVNSFRVYVQIKNNESPTLLTDVFYYVLNVIKNIIDKIQTFLFN